MFRLSVTIIFKFKARSYKEIKFEKIKLLSSVMLNIHQILAVTASMAYVADAIDIKPECVEQKGVTIGAF